MIIFNYFFHAFVTLLNDTLSRPKNCYQAKFRLWKHLKYHCTVYDVKWRVYKVLFFLYLAPPYVHSRNLKYFFFIFNPKLRVMATFLRAKCSQKAQIVDSFKDFAHIEVTTALDLFLLIIKKIRILAIDVGEAKIKDKRLVTSFLRSKLVLYSITDII